MARKWSAAQRRKFSATVKAKSRKATQSFPLAIIPARPVQTSAREVRASAAPMTRDLRIALAMALVQAVRDIVADR